MSSHMNCSARIAALMLFGLGLAGCDGGTGVAGSSGDTGPAGPPGGTGPSVGNNIPVTSAERIDVTFTSVSVSADGGAPTVEYYLTNERGQGLVGLPAANVRFVIAQLTPGTKGGSSAWQSYITGDDGGVTDAQATTETATAGTYVDNDDGTYVYTFANALTQYPAGPEFDATKTHRLGIEIRTSSGEFWPENIPATNAPFDFLPSVGTPFFTRLIVDNDTCNACHDNLEAHGEARFDVEYCVQCHNPSSLDGNTGNSVDMKRLIHNIHSGRPDYQIIGFGDRLHEWSDVVFPQDIRNCQTCHDESDANTPQASNWRLVPSRAACGTCHYDDGDAVNGQHDFAIEDGIHPVGLEFVDDIQCVDCHGETATVTNDAGQLVRIDEAHRIPGLEASENFIFNVLAARNVVAGGAPLEVDYSVTDASGVPYDLDNDPEFTTCADGTSRLAIDIGWTTDDFTNSAAGTSNAQPVGINALGAGCGGAGTDVDGDGVYTAVASSGLPAGLTGSIAVALEGHPGSDLDGDGTIGGRNDRVAVTSAIEYFGVDGAAATPRRNAVLIEKCDDCHKQLSMHGNNRTDKPEVCAICHNPNATDINRRVAGSDCVTELGTDDQAIDLKNMIHGIHSGNVGVCGFGNSAHPYFDVVYPGRLNNCEGCHAPGGYYPVEPGALLGTTVDANDPSTPTDDVVVSPNSSVCSACHTSSLAADHMISNGGDFSAGKAADSSLISSGVESCVVCHGAGRAFDVEEVHGVGTFLFN
ncbi:MAG: OmcA/MtrC family decaheme c-type cytochrome [Gammaproteobacteria bacterium]|nr:OmcA/MtrC family decaheme c-type cytochrome [Gammaproteobacteria bacterium]MDH3750661.1 OmcA/MtrC family decaheme c-type cytochrome [Gammaproteobacteria bacterium]